MEGEASQPMSGQIQKLKERLKDWCREHSDEISEAYLVPSVAQERWWFAVMKKDRHYSKDFARNLTRFVIIY